MPLPFPLEEPGCRLFARARHGLWQAARASGLNEGDEVLAPAYHHGSEIEALRRAGLVCRFYEATETLAPGEDELERLLTARTRALHLTHFLGFPQDGRRWRRWCDERGLLLIEDAAQSWLTGNGGRPVGSDGDITVYCLYKSFGLPDGAALLTRTAVPPPQGRRPLGAQSLAMEHALWLVTHSELLSRAAEGTSRAKNFLIRPDLALGDPNSPPSAMTLLVLPRIASMTAAERRRQNYRQLHAARPDLVPRAFADLPPEASPFVFPIECDDKTAVMSRLRSIGIRSLDLWPNPHPMLARAEFPRAAALRRRTIGMPVHQELRSKDLARIVKALREL